LRPQKHETRIRFFVEYEIGHDKNFVLFCDFCSFYTTKSAIKLVKKNYTVFVFCQNSRNSFKISRICTVKFPLPILTKFRPILPKFDSFLVFCALIRAYFGQFGNNSALVRPKTCIFDRFLRISAIAAIRQKTKLLCMRRHENMWKIKVLFACHYSCHSYFIFLFQNSAKIHKKLENMEQFSWYYSHRRTTSKLTFWWKMCGKHTFYVLFTLFLYTKISQFSTKKVSYHYASKILHS
jgi:hypothetical protein